MVRFLLCKEKTRTTLIACLAFTQRTPITCFCLNSQNGQQKISNRLFSSISFGKNHIANTKIIHNYITNSVLFSTNSGEVTVNTMTTKKKVLVPIADGSEEIETTCITDTLVRFGADVTIASVKSNNDLICTMSRGIKVMADCSINDVADYEYDLIVLPGGMPGAEHLKNCEVLIKMLHQQKANGKLYGAICASPAIALHPNGLLDIDTIATCYPAPHFRETIAVNFLDPTSKVIISKNCITSQVRYIPVKLPTNKQKKNCFH